MLAALAAFYPTAWAQNSNLSEHERTVKAESDRNTAYHNNADDNSKADPNSNAAIAKKIADSFKSNRPNAAAEAAAWEHRNNDARYAEYERKHEYLNQLSATAANGNYEAGLAAAGMYARGEGTRPLPEHAFELYTLIGERQPDGFYQAGLLLLDGGTVATDWKLARDEPRAMGLITKAADRGSIPAKKWLAENAPSTAGGAALPGMDKLFEATIRAYAKSVPPTDPKKNQKLMDQATNSSKMSVNFQKQSHIHATLMPVMINAGIATLFGVGMPADPVAADKVFNFTPRWYDETNIPAFFAYIHWTAAPGTLATYQRIDKDLSSQDVEHNHRPLVEYTRALVATGLNNPLRARQLLVAEVTAQREGYVQMMVDLAVMQLEGRGGPRDEAAGLAALNAAAGWGNDNAKYVLGLLYEKGLHGVPRDPAHARELFTAAVAGQPAAQAHLTGNPGTVAQTTKP